MPLLLRAAEWAASVAAYADGAAWVEQALEHAPEELRPRLLTLLAQLLDGTGDSRASAAYADAVAVGRHGAGQRPPAQAGASVHRHGRPRRGAGDGRRGGGRDDRGARPCGDAARRSSRGSRATRRHRAATPSEAEPLLERARLHEDLAMLDDVRAMMAHAEGDWEAHSRWRLRESGQLPELAGRVFDAYLCVTEYVLYSGEPYEQLAGFAKRLRAPGTAGRRAAWRGVRRDPAGRDRAASGNLEAAREHLFAAARLSREVGATGGEALARMRLGEALLHAGDRDGARRPARGGARALARLQPRAPPALPGPRRAGSGAERSAGGAASWSTRPTRCCRTSACAPTARPATTWPRR